MTKPVLIANGPVHCKISILYTTGFGGSSTATYFGVTFKLLEKAMFYSVVSIWRIITTITGINAFKFITGEMLVISCFSRKVAQISCNLFGVNLHIFTVKTAQLPPLLVSIFASLCRLLITFAHSLDSDQA